MPISPCPAVEVETKKLPAAEDTSPTESDFADNVGTQVIAKWWHCFLKLCYIPDFQSHHVCSRTTPCSPKLRLLSKLAIQEDVDFSFYKSIPVRNTKRDIVQEQCSIAQSYISCYVLVGPLKLKSVFQVPCQEASVTHSFLVLPYGALPFLSRWIWFYFIKKTLVNI